jgi:hypothetical protein
VWEGESRRICATYVAVCGVVRVCVMVELWVCVCGSGCVCGLAFVSESVSVIGSVCGRECCGWCKSVVTASMCVRMWMCE